MGYASETFVLFFFGWGLTKERVWLDMGIDVWNLGVLNHYYYYFLFFYFFYFFWVLKFRVLSGQWGFNSFGNFENWKWKWGSTKVEMD